MSASWLASAEPATVDPAEQDCVVDRPVLSAHAFGIALDIRGFELADCEQILIVFARHQTEGTFRLVRATGEESG